MFKNVGKEIKGMAERYIISALIPFVLIGIAIFAVLAWMGYAIVGLIAAVCIVLWKYANARREVILLYAYGELIDRVQSLEEHIVLQSGKTNKRKKRQADEDSDSFEDDKNSVSSNAGDPTVERNEDGTWTCWSCDHINAPNAKSCAKCHTVAHFE